MCLAQGHYMYMTKYSTSGVPYATIRLPSSPGLDGETLLLAYIKLRLATAVCFMSHQTDLVIMEIGTQL